jgi:4-aminobutyrate aminotransferase-like enzyme
MAGLRGLGTKYRSIGDVRGLGLMLALEFVRPDEGDGRVPDADLTKRVLAEALERKLIVLSAGTYANVSRIIPPLVTTADEVDLALRILDQSLAAAGA